jgi:hypothetical protein
VPEISYGENDARADDANAHLAGAGDGKHEDLTFAAPVAPS